MNPLLMVNVLFQALSAAPALESDIKAVLTAHWDHNIVADARQGINFLSKLLDDAQPVIEEVAPPAALPASPPSGAV